MNDGYIESCIAALPPEKRGAAREAFNELISEGASDHLLTRLLLVFEASSAFASQIPRELAATMEHGVAAIDARLESLKQAGAGPAQGVGERACLPSADALEKLTASIQVQSVAIGRVAASVTRFRHARVGSFLAFTVLAFVTGAGLVAGLYYQDYTDAQKYRRYWRSIQQRGVSITTDLRASAFVFRIEGPRTRAATEWVRDASGQICGAEIVFPEP